MLEASMSLFSSLSTLLCISEVSLSYKKRLAGPLLPVGSSQWEAAGDWRARGEGSWNIYAPAPSFLNPKPPVLVASLTATTL